MQIIAASIEKAADVFLHAGYTSAYPSQPHALDPAAYGGVELLRIDVAEALRLKAEAVGASVQAHTEGMSVALSTWDSDWRGALLLVAAFFLALGACYVARGAVTGRLALVKPRARWAVALVALLGLTCSVGPDSPTGSQDDVFVAGENVLMAEADGVAATDYAESEPDASEGEDGVTDPGTIDPGGTDPGSGDAVKDIDAGSDLPAVKPWEGVTVQEYLDPELATRAILNGLLVDALANAPYEVISQVSSSLGQGGNGLYRLASEIGFPKKELTPGEAYALQTFGLDGWGREFRLLHKVASQYKWVITSAGADGDFETPDDIETTVKLCSDELWAGCCETDQMLGNVNDMRWGFWVRIFDGSPVVLFHRWTGSKFVYNSLATAKELTGGTLYDVLVTQALLPEGQTLAAEAWDSFASPEEDRLILQVFEPDPYKGCGCSL
jgi:hypothetical protein